MSNREAPLDRIVSAWTRGIMRRSRLVVALSGLLVAAALYFTAGNLGINTDTSEMLAPELPFRINHERYKELFPGNRGGLTLVIDATTADLADEAARTLVERLREQPQHVRSAGLPGGAEFFRDYRLLYMSLDDLESLSRTLVAAEPFIGSILDDASLRGLVSALADAFLASASEENEQNTVAPDAALIEAVRHMGIAVESFLQGDPYEIPWSEVILGKDAVEAGKRVHVTVLPELDHTRILPAGGAMDAIRRTAAEIENDGIQWVDVRVTGQTALEHEELEAVSRSAVRSGLFALVMVCLCLFVGLGSLWMMVASLLTLVAGLVLSAAFAAAAVGDLNMISLAFAVLYIGLGIDYAIHLVLRYRELADGGARKSDAIGRSVVDVGSAVSLCAVTTSLGFFAFVPTAYAGVAELGLISGTSMFIGLAVTLTLLPALLDVLPEPSVRTLPSHTAWRRFVAGVAAVPYRHGRAVRRGSLAAAAVGAVLLTGASFDSNPNNLRDPESESVSTFEDLLSGSRSSPWTISVLESDPEATRETANRLAGLPLVAETRVLEDLVPADQAAKLAVIRPLATMFPERFGANTLIHEDSVEDQVLAVRDFRDLTGFASNRADAALEPTLVLLSRRLRDLLFSLEGRSAQVQATMLTDLNRLLLGSLIRTLDDLFRGLRVERLDLAGFPEEVKRSWVASDGTRRIQVFPEEDLSDPRAMEAFVDDVFTVTRQATDLPVIYVEAGREVVTAFLQAFVGALLAITVVLLVVFKSVKSTLVVLTPLLLATIMAGAMTVVLRMPFNFANIIVLPLLFGLGVDNGIHIFHRIHSLGTQGRSVLQTSTARGVVFSGLTTVLSFSSLAFTSHRGMSSLGILLGVGVLLIQAVTLLVLPALLGERAGPPTRTAAPVPEAVLREDRI